MEMKFRYTRIDSSIHIDRYIGSAESITIPEQINGMPVSWHLTEVIIPRNIKLIGTYAFFECNNLAEIILPKGVTSIGDSIFPKESSLLIIGLANIAVRSTQ